MKQAAAFDEEDMRSAPLGLRAPSDLRLDGCTEILSPEWIESLRLEATRHLAPGERSRLGQFLTPEPVARFMASFFGPFPQVVRILDPGAGIGSLTAAVVSSLAERDSRPRKVMVVAYEIDPVLATYLRRVMRACEGFCSGLGIDFESEVRERDFIESAADALRSGLFADQSNTFTHVITNPPYAKVTARSRHRLLLSEAGLETSNTYSGFVFLAGSQLAQGGELVAITPRSFCNGAYFRAFRRFLVDSFAFRRCHVFESRDTAFGQDGVLQENVILSAVKEGTKQAVLISAGDNPIDEGFAIREIRHEEFVEPSDPDLFFRLAIDDGEGNVAVLLSGLRCTLDDLGIAVSTGRVVDFRAAELLRKEPSRGTAPLLYPAHMQKGGVVWPVPGFRKFNAILDNEDSRSLLVPKGTYVLTRRFSAKEEPRRVVASLLSLDSCPGERIGIENHLNYFHAGGSGIDEDLARGLCLFLNSSLLDRYFRQFSGHTQVNAADLRNIRYPDCEALRRAGRRWRSATCLEQREVDRIVQEELFDMAQGREPDALVGSRRIEEALEILGNLGLPKAQQNERSALTLLALLDLKPGTPWSEAGDPLCGITQMMSFFEQHYGKKYAPNTRETVRRFTTHQFVQAGLVVENPDNPDRPTNSPKTCYRIAPIALAAIRTFGTQGWDAAVRELLRNVVALRDQYSQEREMHRICVKQASGEDVYLSPGGQNPLIKEIVEQFCARFTPDGIVVYIGDAAAKWGYFDESLLASLGVEIPEHGKIPDVIVYLTEKNWLVLIEAVTSHGPVNPKRHIELKELFEDSTAGLVFVSAFPDRRTMLKHLNEVAWETDVWCADAPSHLIHFNGERFLGPY